MRLRSALAAAFVFAFTATPARAQQRTVTVEFTPTARVQLAMWIENADHSIWQTVRLTYAVAVRGIGNRPGAMQMDSGYRWPYGRREGVLPIWAHRRATASGNTFRRVIFVDRPEGYASRAGDEFFNTPEPHDGFCLSFTGHESIDAISCASVFNSNKGRYMTATDMMGGYSEPFEDAPGMGHMRPLTLESLYPPRGDAMPIACTSNCDATHHDHDDVLTFPMERARVMPELDAVTMATLPRDMPYTYTFDVPAAWPDGDYTLFIEANTEFDFADPAWHLSSPLSPADWDCYANDQDGCTYGHPWRGQPSVLYAVPISIGATAADGNYTISAPSGHGDLYGLSGDVTTMSGSGMLDDPANHPGSGADRLRADASGARVTVHVPMVDPCRSAMPPPRCGMGCQSAADCMSTMPLLCNDMHQCVGQCAVTLTPAAPIGLTAAHVDDIHHSHEWAHVSFVVPEVQRGIDSYEVRVSSTPITDEASFMAARPAQAATAENQAVTVPTTGAAGDTVGFDIGQLSPSSHVYVGVRLYDGCHAAGLIAAADFTTTAIHFTTVQPCFVATAAYGSALDARIGVLRRFRDRYLMSNAIGRALVAGYYELGPTAASWIAESDDRRAGARSLLDPIVRAIAWLDD
jgi:hypothetical protein